MLYEVATRLVISYATRVEAESPEAAEQIVAGPDFQWPNLANWGVESEEVWALPPDEQEDSSED